MHPPAQQVEEEESVEEEEEQEVVAEVREIKVSCAKGDGCNRFWEPGWGVR